jgi:hypothetical protein
MRENSALIGSEGLNAVALDNPNCGVLHLQKPVRAFGGIKVIADSPRQSASHVKVRRNAAVESAILEPGAPLLWQKDKQEQGGCR